MSDTHEELVAAKQRRRVENGVDVEVADASKERRSAKASSVFYLAGGIGVAVLVLAVSLT